jgi:hypothetical protein
MAIERIEDVIVPQKDIGIDIGWEDEIFPILKSYVDFLGDEMTLPTSIDDIKNSERALGTTLPEDLKKFHLRFGAAKLTEGLFGVNEFQYLSTSWDKKMLDHYDKVEQDVLSNLIVFGDYLGNGNVWCFHKITKEIFYFKHDSKPNINRMFQTFYQYLQSLLIFSQGEMGQGIAKIDEECEKIVVDLIGKDRVKVWQSFDGWE